MTKCQRVAMHSNLVSEGDLAIYDTGSPDASTALLFGMGRLDTVLPLIWLLMGTCFNGGKINRTL